jgi:hypothetical protein
MDFVKAEASGIARERVSFKCMGDPAAGAVSAISCAPTKKPAPSGAGFGRVGIYRADTDTGMVVSPWPMPFK